MTPEQVTPAPNPVESSKDAIFKRLLSNPNNVLTTHEVDSVKNPIVSSNHRPVHSDVVITSIKDDKSLLDRDVDNADKIKQRRRRSSSKKRSNLTNIDTTSNS